MGLLSFLLLTFQLPAQNWNEIINLTASDGASQDQFSYSVDIDGDYAIVGARYDDDNAANSGSVYIFHRSAGIWSEQTKLTPATGNTNDEFGHSVSIDGDYAVVGAIRDDEVGFDRGAAYVYKRTASLISAIVCPLFNFWIKPSTILCSLCI